MFSWFERRIDPFRPEPAAPPPPGLGAFYWHFTRQIWPWLIAMLVSGFAVAAVEVMVYAFFGRIVDILAHTTPDRLWAEHGTTLLLMGAVVLFGRPLTQIIDDLISRQTVMPSFTALIRWQSHRRVVRQSLSFFQNDFAGRIASRVMTTAPSLRGSLVDAIDSLWYAVLYTGGAVLVLGDLDPLLALPLIIWVAAYLATLAVFLPKLRRNSSGIAQANALLSGRVVDGYTNIQTVKLFAHAEREDAYVKSALSEHMGMMRTQMRTITAMTFTVTTLSALLMTAMAATAITLWVNGAVSVGAIAVGIGLASRLSTMSGWIMWSVNGVFENIGTVQEGLATITPPLTVTDAPDAKPLVVRAGEIRFEQARFTYGRGTGGIGGLDLVIPAGSRIGLVGRSGAGKSTLVSLLLRFHDLEAGTIRIDGQDIARVTQESLRSAIGVVTQDTSLLHRSVAENIAYGRPDASRAEIEAAAARARAADFIPGLADPNGRTGYDAHVGERGVKLSGGQRQRIAIARVLLKDAPILILDEATSALDSEVEAAIQDELDTLMAGKTVVAIAHRLSTIARMDRLVVLDAGRIVETGTHDELIAAGGLYASLWQRQSGGFLGRLENAAE